MELLFVTLTLAFVATALGMMLVTLAKSRKQADSIGLMIDFGFGALGGYLRAPDNGNWLQKNYALSQYENEINSTRLATGTFFISRQVFVDIGGFNETIIAGEDTDISKRLVERGFPFLVSPSASVIHYGYPKTIKEFLEQCCFLD